jgi:hypothetical protein
MENKMTNREVLTLIANGTANDTTKECAMGMIAKLDEKNAKRKNTETKAQKENKELMGKIVEVIGNGTMVASDIGKALGVSTQKASALCTLLVKDGTLSVCEIKVKGKGSVKGYSLAEVVD